MALDLDMMAAQDKTVRSPESGWGRVITRDRGSYGCL